MYLPVNGLSYSSFVDRENTQYHTLKYELVITDFQVPSYLLHLGKDDHILQYLLEFLDIDGMACVCACVP